MGSQKPILGAAKPDLVAVILERSVAQQLALALAWALGSTGGGKSKTKAGGSEGPAKEDVGQSKVPGGGKIKIPVPQKSGAAKTAAKKSGAGKAAASKSGASKSAATKSGAKKTGGKKSGGGSK